MSHSERNQLNEQYINYIKISRAAKVYSDLSVVRAVAFSY